MTKARVGHNSKALKHPQIKDQAKFVKKVKVPASANHKTGKQGDWGKSNG